MGYPWSSGETLLAADLNAAIAGASVWHAGVVTAIGTNLTLAGGVLSAAAGSVTSVAGRTGAVTLTHSDLTDWTSATSSFLTSTTAASTYAPIASPTFTGTVTIPGGASISGYLTTATAASTYAPLASPTFTGSPTVPGYLTTATAASTYAPLASPTFTGSPTVPGYLTTATAASTYAPLASPTLTGTPAAPTATLGTTTTQVATTAFVAAAVTAATAGVASFNTRTGAVTLTSGDVTTALTFTPYSNANPSGYQTAANVTTTLASPPAIGGSAAAAGSFTTLSASSTVSGTGFSTYLASPPAIGGSAAAAGSFTTLSASSTVSGTGFSTYLASPPAIGGSAAAAGSFTTLSASSTVSGAGITSLLSPYAPLASPTFSGTPSLPTGTTGVTQGAGDNTTKLATTAFVTTATAASGGGGAVSTPSSNQTLTAASSRAQSYAFTASNLTVTLPDATTLSTGGALFSLYNAGGYTFGVRRNGGTLLTVVPPGSAAGLYLDDNGTAAGVWHATGQGLQSAFETASTTLTGALIASTTTLLGFIGSVAIYWAGSGAATSIQAFDTAGGTVGSVATLTSAATSPILLTVDSTHGLIVYYGSSNICAQVLTLSGTSITVQTQATIATGTPTGLAAAVTLTTGSSYLVAYNISAGADAVQLGVSGTTATFGTAAAFSASVNWIATRPLNVISSTQVFGVVAATSNAVRVIGISGSTVTMNTAASATNASTIALALSTTLFLLCETNSLQAVSVSGTTCTAGTAVIWGSNAFTAGQFVASSTSFIVGSSASPGVLYYGTISGTTITQAASLTVANDWVPGGTSAATTLVNNPLAAVSAGYLYVPSEGVLTASGSAFSVAQPDLWPDQMVVSGGVALQDGAGGTVIPIAAGDGFTSLATAQTSGNLLIKPGRVYPVGGYTAALSGAISTGKFLIGTASPGRTAPTGTGALWRVATWELAT